MKNTLDISQFEKRKSDHLEHAIDPQNQASGSGLESVELLHDAVCELNFNEISIAAIRFKGTPYRVTTKTPFYVSAMTGGAQASVQINLTLAKACENLGWALGMGSQRRELDSGCADSDWKNIREHFPDLALFSNIGAAQIIGVDPQKILRLTKDVDAQALAVHLNALQEAIQIEGTPQFKGFAQALSDLSQACTEEKIPLIIKETGCGFSMSAISKLTNLSISALDVSGRGGTHWGRIEGSRGRSKSATHFELSETFKNWGISTVDSLLNARRAAPSLEIWASGGIRTGLDAAKAIALGASQVGFAMPALKAALEGPQALEQWMNRISLELRTAMFCTNHSNIEALREARQWTRNEN